MPDHHGNELAQGARRSRSRRRTDGKQSRTHPQNDHPAIVQVNKELSECFLTINDVGERGRLEPWEFKQILRANKKIFEKYEREILRKNESTSLGMQAQLRLEGFYERLKDIGVSGEDPDLSVPHRTMLARLNRLMVVDSKKDQCIKRAEEAYKSARNMASGLAAINAVRLGSYYSYAKFKKEKGEGAKAEDLLLEGIRKVVDFLKYYPQEPLSDDSKGKLMKMLRKLHVWKSYHKLRNDDLIIIEQFPWVPARR